MLRNTEREQPNVPTQQTAKSYLYRRRDLEGLVVPRAPWLEIVDDTAFGWSTDENIIGYLVYFGTSQTLIVNKRHKHKVLFSRLRA
eukprot:snap_masked-scaffold_34-processed-gene-0.27-mRNA-1 protein AED:1.00 eAED:1.00 QI:0/-1/0/0/-1/1/1/0/85